jgi:uncharacterized membrane protein
MLGEWLKEKRVAFIICILALLGFLYVLLYKYYHLGYYDWDLAFFTQACWQLLHGSQFIPLTGINYFGDHSYFITFFYLPIFALAPHPLTLIILKLFAFIMAAFLLYKIMEEELGQGMALILMVLYITFPANIFALLYDFNPENFAPPILLWMFMMFQKRRWRAFLIAALLLMTIKENMALIVGAFGIYGLFRKDMPLKVSLLTLAVAALIFYILTCYLIPHFRHLVQHAFVVRYDYLGHNLKEIFITMLTDPHKVFVSLTLNVNQLYVRNLFGPLLIPALMSPHILFLMSPVFLQHLLSIHVPEHSIYYHYGPTVVVFIFLAVGWTFTWWRKKLNPKVFIAIAILVMFLSGIHIGHYREQFSLRLNYHGNDQLEAFRWALIKSVPANEGVVTTFDFLAPLALREHVYSFHKIYDEFYQNPQKMEKSELNTQKRFILPDQVHYALIDFNDFWLKKDLKENYQSTDRRIQNFLTKEQWQPIKSFGHMVLYKKI